MTAMYLAGLVARDMTAFHTVWKEVNLVDAGARSDTFNDELCQSHYG